METKKCSKCKQNVDIKKFSPTSKNKKTGKQYYHSWCNPCRTQADRDKRGQKEPKQFANKTDTHRECMNCHEMVLYEETFGGSYCKSCYKELYYDKDRNNRHVKEYRERHKERVAARRRIGNFNRYRQIKATDDGTVTDEFLKEVYSTENCYWCGEHTPRDKRTLEHVIELSQGGPHSALNIEMACWSCNSARKNK